MESDPSGFIKGVETAEAPKTSPYPRRSAVRSGVLTGLSAAVLSGSGAIAGAYHGAAAIPARWLDSLEKGPKGRSHIERLADQLFARTTETRSVVRSS